MERRTIKESFSCNNSKGTFAFVYLPTTTQRFVENNCTWSTEFAVGEQPRYR